MITDDDLRDLFSQRADDVRTTHEIPRALLWRVRRRQRVVGFAAAAAAGVLIVGVLASATLLSRSEVMQRERDTATIDLLPPTPDRLAGIWARQEGPNLQPTQLLIRFSRNGDVAYDDLGLLDSTPAILGNYSVAGDTITFRAGPESVACEDGDTWAFRASLTQDGQLNVEVTEDGTGNCRVGLGTEWVFARVSPRSQAGARIPADRPTDRGIFPLTPHMTGIWFREDGQLLSLGADMSYRADDGGKLDTNPDDKGEYKVEGRTITFTSGAESITCPDGAVRVWKNLRLSARTLRGVVVEDECADSVGDEQTWILLSGGGYPGVND
jgi:hypothetical protein